MNNWQPIETAPFDTDVLVYDGVTVWKAYQNEETSWNPYSFWRLTLNDSGRGCMRLVRPPIFWLPIDDILPPH